VIRHINKKPAVHGAILEHFGLTEKDRALIAMVGDRILTDTLMGNASGFYTIDTRAFSFKRENYIVKAVKHFERNLLPYITPTKFTPHFMDHIDKFELTQ
jgi:predicted HAD superfamily phosphohydrolase YqeG